MAELNAKEINKIVDNAYFKGVNDTLKILENNFWNHNIFDKSCFNITNKEWQDFKNQVLENTSNIHKENSK